VVHGSNGPENGEQEIGATSSKLPASHAELTGLSFLWCKEVARSRLEPHIVYAEVLTHGNGWMGAYSSLD
jgi:hypothetical protein